MNNPLKEKQSKILIVDDEPVRYILQGFLNRRGYTQVQVVATGREALEIVEKEEIKLVLLDIRLPDINGMDVLKKIKQIKPATGVIMITGFPEEDLAKTAVKEGAYDYIVKPFDLNYLELCVLSKISGLA